MDLVETSTDCHHAMASRMLTASWVTTVHFCPARGMLWVDLNGAHHPRMAMVVGCGARLVVGEKQVLRFARDDNMGVGALAEFGGHNCETIRYRSIVARLPAA
ncbi:MAG: hypothetical protein NVSMB62_15010 [Acidobacteriaceae bacterium]